MRLNHSVKVLLSDFLTFPVSFRLLKEWRCSSWCWYATECWWKSKVERRQQLSPAFTWAGQNGLHDEEEEIQVSGGPVSGRAFRGLLQQGHPLRQSQTTWRWQLHRRFQKVRRALKHKKSNYCSNFKTTIVIISEWKYKIIGSSITLAFNSHARWMPMHRRASSRPANAESRYEW